MSRAAPPLSKSRLLAFRQCPKRLWLTVNDPHLLDESSSTQASYDAGNRLGEVAQDIFNNGKGQIFDVQADGVALVIAKTQKAIAETSAEFAERSPLFEAGFEAVGVRAFVDVLQPALGPDEKSPRWHIIEVKSAASVKDVHLEDAAIQYYAATAAGLKLDSIAIAHVTTDWTYDDDGDYVGLLTTVDVTHDIQGLVLDVPRWVIQAQTVLRKRKAPAIATGAHCPDPYPCGFLAYCQSQEPAVEHPVQWLPRIQTKALRAHVQKPKVRAMHDVPDELLNALQQRVKNATLSGRAYFNRKGAAVALAEHGERCYFLDFETLADVVPRWLNTRAFQQVPFQFSLHCMGPRGGLSHVEFLDTSGSDPRQPLVNALIKGCGKSGAVFAYNAGFEGRCLQDLADYFCSEPKLERALLAIKARLVDLQPIARANYYHPSQQGSWSLKAVVPALLPHLSYDKQAGLQNGTDAQLAYTEAADNRTCESRKLELRGQLLSYCKLDTLALVEMWRKFKTQ